VNIRAIAITPDGTVWFASGPQWNPPTDQMWGLARWDGGAFTYYDPRAMGLPTNAIMDMVAMPDGTLEIGTTQGLFRYDPSTKALHSIAGLPSDSIERLYLDPTVTPPALYVATDSGLAVLRD
jgi:ligand-binding sensor domain-containing protein